MNIVTLLFAALSLSFSNPISLLSPKYSLSCQNRSINGNYFEELKRTAPEMGMNWEIKGDELMKTQVKYTHPLTAEQVKSLFHLDKKGEETAIWNDACDYGAYGQYSVFEGYTCFLIFSESINEEFPEMEDRKIWCCSMSNDGTLIDYRIVASYTNISEGMDIGKVISTRNFSHIGEHGLAHYQDSERCPNPNDCKPFTNDEHAITYFEDGTITD